MSLFILLKFKIFNSIKNQEHKYYFFIAIFVLIAELIVNPTGEFPLNDDWSYTLPIFWVSEGKPLEMVNWGAMTLVAHLWWGIGIVKIFGFSFTILRLSVILLGYFTTIFFYKIVYGFTQNNSIAFTSALLLFFNPFFFLLSNSYMTETPFCFCATMALYFVWKNSLYPQNTFYFIGICFFCIMAVLIRQIGIVFPVAILLMSIFTFNIRKILISITPVLLSILAILVFEYWVKINDIQLSYYKSSSFLSTISINVTNLIWVLLLRNGVMWNYMGFFMLPLVLPITIKFIKTINKKEIVGLMLFSLIPIFMSVRAWHEIPVQNLIYDFGLGPILLPYHYQNLINNPPNSFSDIFIVLKIVFEFGAICLTISLYAGIKKTRFTFNKSYINSPKKYFFGVIIFSIALYMIYFFANSVIDRHFVVLVPLFIFILAIIISYYGINLKIVSGLLLITIFFSTAGTMDYFTFNKTKILAVNSLKAKGVSKFDFNAGFEHCGWYHYNKNRYRDWDYFMYSPNQLYLIVNKPVPNYYTDTVLYYNRYLIPKLDSILIIKKSLY